MPDDSPPQRPDAPAEPSTEPRPAVTLSYAPTPNARNGAGLDMRNGAAVAALVVGILAVVVFPIGTPLGIMAIALGLVALARGRNLPPIRARRGQALVGVCLGAIGAAVWADRFAGLFRPTCVSTARSNCASNLRGIGQALLVYSNDNAGWYPICIYNDPPTGPEDETVVSFVGQLGAYYNTSLTRSASPAPGVIPKPPCEARPDPPGLSTMQNSIHPSRSLFMLVIDGSFTAKQVVCPSSGDVEDDLRGKGKSETGWAATDLGQSRFDFRGYNNLSYGYQLPFGRHAKPSESLDPKMPIMADKGPYFTAGPARPDGTIPDQPAMAAGSLMTIPGATTAEQLLNLREKAWRPYNSRNHRGDGQNVLHVDGSVTFEPTPIVGIGGDNIYTNQGPGYSRLETLLGRVPTDKLGPLTDTDSVIVP